jgi:hypothetical protein
MSGRIYCRAIVNTYPKDKIPRGWVPNMYQWMGKEVTLIIDSGAYKIAEDPGWMWSADEFRILGDNELNPNILFKQSKKRTEE